MDRRFEERLRTFVANMAERAAEHERERPAIEAAEARLREQYAEARKAGFVRHLGSCGAPETVLDAYRAGVQARPALVAVKRWLEGPKTFCLLLGSNGIGKSVAAAYALRGASRMVKATPEHPMAEAIQVERLDSAEGFFLTASQLRFASRFVEGKGLSVLDRAATVSVLVLDELRADDFQGKGLERLEEILTERHAYRLRTVITSNLTGAEVLERVGPRLASRLSEAAEVFEGSGEDMRRRA